MTVRTVDLVFAGGSAVGSLVCGRGVVGSVATGLVNSAVYKVFSKCKRSDESATYPSEIIALRCVETLWAVVPLNAIVGAVVGTELTLVQEVGISAVAIGASIAASLAYVHFKK